MEWAGSHLTVVDALDLAVVATDVDGRIVVWSAGAQRLYGWTVDEAIGRPILEVLTPVGPPAPFEEFFAHVVAGGVSGGDRVILRQDGQPVRVHTTARPLRDASGAVVGVVGMAQDVTELRLVEQRARDTSSHLQLALDAGGLGTWRWDIPTGELVWDERMEALFGLEPGTFEGTYSAYVELIHPDDRDAVEATVQRAIDTRSSVQVQHRVVWPDGSIHWLSRVGGPTFAGDGSVVGTIGCAGDVTERMERDAQRQLDATEALRRADAEQVERERLEFLGAVNDALNSSTTVEEIMANVTAASVPRLGDWCAIHVLNDQGGRIPDVAIAHVDPDMVEYARALQERFPYDPDAPRGVAAVIRDGVSEFYPEIDPGVLSELELSDEERSVVDHLALRSAIAVPLVKRDRVLGAMQFVMSHSSRRYSDADLRLAEAVAARIAASIVNRRLVEHEVRMSRTLQRSLLPSALPELDGVEIAVRYWPAGEAAVVGGDFYDVFEIDERRWAVAVGDVCGTGPEAAAITGLARHTLRTSVWHGDTPSDALSMLNRAMHHGRVPSFCTAVVAEFDRRDDGIEMTVACGGHPLPVLVTTAGARQVGIAGQLLGVFASVSCEPARLTLAPGDTLVFYTDGATDAAPPYGLDAEQFTALVGRAVGVTADATANNIHHELERLRPFSQRSDDLALLVVRIR